MSRDIFTACSMDIEGGDDAAIRDFSCQVHGCRRGNVVWPRRYSYPRHEGPAFQTCKNTGNVVVGNVVGSAVTGGQDSGAGVDSLLLALPLPCWQSNHGSQFLGATISAVCFSGDTKYVACHIAEPAWCIQVWNWNTGRVVCSGPLTVPVSQLTFNPLDATQV